MTPEAQGELAVKLFSMGLDQIEERLIAHDAARLEMARLFATFLAESNSEVQGAFLDRIAGHLTECCGSRPGRDMQLLSISKEIAADTSECLSTLVAFTTEEKR